MSEAQEHHGGGGGHHFFGPEYVELINTTHFPEAIKSIETMAKAMDNLLVDLDDYKAYILENWVGDGRNQFESSYRIMKRKLTDGSDINWDMYEKLIAAQEMLIQADHDVSNGIKEYR
jgi:uncharacterized protein YukE